MDREGRMKKWKFHFNFPSYQTNTKRKKDYFSLEDGKMIHPLFPPSQKFQLLDVFQARWFSKTWIRIDTYPIIEDIGFWIRLDTTWI